MNNILRNCFGAWSDYNIKEQVKRINISDIKKQQRKANRALLRKVMKAYTEYIAMDKTEHNSETENANEIVPSSTRSCKCKKVVGESCVYAWNNGESVMICEQCQCIDESFTNYNNNMRLKYASVREPESEPQAHDSSDDEKLNTGHFWTLIIHAVAITLEDTNEYKAMILDKTDKIHHKHLKTNPFNTERYYKKRLIRLHNFLRNEEKRLPKHELIKKIKEDFESYEEAFMTSANVFRKIHRTNTKFMMKLDAYENSLKHVHPVCVNKNDKLTALVTLKEQPSILDNLFCMRNRILRH